MAAEEQSGESKHQQEKDCHVFDSFHPSRCQSMPLPADGVLANQRLRFCEHQAGCCNLIREGDDHQLYSPISTGRNDYMVSMEQSFAEMVRDGRISRDTRNRALLPSGRSGALSELRIGG